MNRKISMNHDLSRILLNNRMSALYINFPKAFDRVDQNILGTYNRYVDMNDTRAI